MPGKVKQTTTHTHQGRVHEGGARAGLLSLVFPKLLTHHALSWLLLPGPGKVIDIEMWRREADALAAPYHHPLCLGAKPGNVCPFPLGRFIPVAPVKSLVLQAATRDQKMAFYLDGEGRREDKNQGRISPFIHGRRAPDASLLGGGRWLRLKTGHPDL